MKILHINTYDSGGAATAIIRIHKALLKKKLDSKILFLHRSGSTIPEAHSFKPRSGLLQRFCRRYKKLRYSNPEIVLRRYPEIEHYTDGRSLYDLSEHPLVQQADIIQLNWVSGFLDEASFFKKINKPVVWRMPDLYCCGGGYHYERNFPFKDLATRLQKNKIRRKKALKNARSLHFVPISNWVLDKANAPNSLIKEFPKSMIHNGLDVDLFKPHEQLKAREHFGIPLAKKVILLGAHLMHLERKGVAESLYLIQQLDQKEVHFVLFSKSKIKLPGNCTEVGYLNDPQELAKLYSAADYFLMSSKEEAFGQVTIEALATGTPVISFPNGGSLDIITDGFNGVLAKDISKESLLEATRRALSINFDSDQIRSQAVEAFNIDNKVAEFIKLYQDLLSGHRH